MELKEKVKFKIKGTYNGKTVQIKEIKRFHGLENVFSGERLDALELKANVTNMIDIDNLITFLKNVRPCFFYHMQETKY